MLSPLAVLLCLGVAPHNGEGPAEAFLRLRKEAFASRVVRFEYGPRFVAHARLYPNHPSAIEALLLATRFSSVTSDLHKQARARLDQHYARSPLVLPLLRNLGLSRGDIQAAFLRRIGDSNPDRRIRGLAWRAMVNGRTSYIEMHRRSPARDQQALPADYMKEVKAEIARWEKDVAEARAKLRSPALAGALADVSVGAKAPPTEAVDLDGRKVSLADHRGKVIVLDFWYTRCGPCRRMVPGTNALIAELKGKPFVQVGVSTDAKPEVVKEHLKTNEMPWAHWWVGYEGKALETWDVEAYPTVYVIDHEGVIRHHQVGFDGDKDKLYDVVRALVRKAEAAARKP